MLLWAQWCHGPGPATGRLCYWVSKDMHPSLDEFSYFARFYIPFTWELLIVWPGCLSIPSSCSPSYS